MITKFYFLHPLGLPLGTYAKAMATACGGVRRTEVEFQNKLWFIFDELV